MTAVATILALVPLAISASGGAIIASDLAKVVIGGLLTSTLLTLVVVPVVYSLLDRQSTVRRRKPESAPPG
jgi:HAE1 family hydrophobic/amphiphilic exporter-1